MAGVSIYEIGKYPPELTDADWQKKKGKIGKLKSTGLGSELKKAEALHKKIDPNSLSPLMHTIKNKEQLAAAKKAVMTYYAQTVEPLRKQLGVVVTVAKKAESTLKSVPLAGDAAKAAGVIANKADHFSVLCKSLDMETPVAEALEKIKRLDENAAKELKASIKKFALGAKAFMSDPSAASWSDNIKQQGRSVSNSVKQLDAYNKQFWKEFEKFKGFDESLLKIVGDDDATKKRRVAIVKMAATQVAAIDKFAP